MREVIERAQAGDREALGALFRSHQHLLLRYFRGLGAASPDDLASQVWIDVASGLRRFTGDELAFRRWLFTIARRRHIDALRRHGRTVARDAAAAGAAREVDHAAFDAFDANDALARSLALLSSLPPDMAEGDPAPSRGRPRRHGSGGSDGNERGQRAGAGPSRARPTAFRARCNGRPLRVDQQVT